MVKITFMGAGSTVFAKNVLGDCMLAPSLSSAEIALYDIDAARLEESYVMLGVINKNSNSNKAVIKKYLGVDNRKNALRGADFVINSIQVGGYNPCTITDFEIPKKYGFRQTIADTTGIGGIFRALRTIPILKGFADDVAEVCPNALFINYTNPMAMLSGFLQRYMPIKSVGICHSVQVCIRHLEKALGIPLSTEAHNWKIAGINHMAWLLEIYDKDGNDLYPKIRQKAAEVLKAGQGDDLVRLEYIRRLGYYCTESSEHNAEYSAFFIKNKYPELIEKYNIPLDEYPRRCVQQIEDWNKLRTELTQNPVLTHERSIEYASYIIESIVDNTPLKFGGNVINNGLITNLSDNACVEIPCIADGNGVTPTRVGALPPQLAAMNMMNINVQLLTIEAAVTLKKEHIYHAAMLDPHCSGELSIDDIVSMCDDLIEAHGRWLPKYV